MPYVARKKEGSDAWETVNAETHEVKATHEPPDAEDKAKAQVRLLDAMEESEGWDGDDE